ncbi:relaxase/mobilization nuclease domain-containing protein [Dyadobacter sandarakinus]|uniref:Relaxase/mobilization nuclease domain-containing protein n=1 Tax=Dyadobacter sandarakinus TaxID=2747268 RepID=A0ABX7I7G8_9BACT|nr:relaxase/mobilization nuclease domain-containing protein [Dyadobacter sandarakinus]QRR01492.1 relaxase/mobilization nuclease domain-containing protein [Dyadobacter sandarakinus]
MIGKVGLGNFAKGILSYCYYEKELSAKQANKMTLGDVRGELIYIQHLGISTLKDGRLDLDYLAKQMLDNRDKNRNLNKYVWHQSFSFPPGEDPPKEKLTTLAQEFAKEFGFSENQMLVFRHNDTKHKHIHIVANRINYNGKNTADHFKNYARTGEFSRRMEMELGLTITPGMSLNQKGKQQAPRQDAAIFNLRSLIDQVLSKTTSIDEFGKQMQSCGFKTYIGRGIAFFNMQNRMKVKGSDLGKDYSLQNLEKRLGLEMSQAFVPVKKKKKSRRKRLGLSI